MSMMKGLVSGSGNNFTMIPQMFISDAIGIPSEGVPVDDNPNIRTWDLGGLSQADIDRIFPDGLHIRAASVAGANPQSVFAPTVSASNLLIGYRERISRTNRRITSQIIEGWGAGADDSIHNEALRATKNWAYHLAAAQDVLLTLLTTNQKRAAMVAHPDSLDADIVFIWYQVMVRNAGVRNAYANSASIADGAVIYTDAFDPSGANRGDPRSLDGAFNVLSGGFIPANFNPGLPTLRNTP